ncbi:myb-like protein u [Anaeramoeba flamelloides]|uniref:Myb-like protein u n=1 Tax=Anaeramoeba flamelloides TaxID=1746091 RepID=A0ABQ8Z7V3_9EUKA|nr:myb-like protein u [Anaeramoeba flamelloides]
MLEAENKVGNNSSQGLNSEDFGYYEEKLGNLLDEERSGLDMNTNFQKGKEIYEELHLLSGIIENGDNKFDDYLPQTHSKLWMVVTLILSFLQLTLIHYLMSYRLKIVDQTTSLVVSILVYCFLLFSCCTLLACKKKTDFDDQNGTKSVKSAPVFVVYCFQFFTLIYYVYIFVNCMTLWHKGSDELVHGVKDYLLSKTNHYAIFAIGGTAAVDFCLKKIIRSQDDVDPIQLTNSIDTYKLCIDWLDFTNLFTACIVRGDDYNSPCSKYVQIFLYLWIISFVIRGAVLFWLPYLPINHKFWKHFHNYLYQREKDVYNEQQNKSYVISEENEELDSKNNNNNNENTPIQSPIQRIHYSFSNRQSLCNKLFTIMLMFSLFQDIFCCLYRFVMSDKRQKSENVIFLYKNFIFAAIELCCILLKDVPSKFIFRTREKVKPEFLFSNLMQLPIVLIIIFELYLYYVIQKMGLSWIWGICCFGMIISILFIRDLLKIIKKSLNLIFDIDDNKQDKNRFFRFYILLPIFTFIILAATNVPFLYYKNQNLPKDGQYTKYKVKENVFIAQISFIFLSFAYKAFFTFTNARSFKILNNFENLLHIKLDGTYFGLKNVCNYFVHYMSLMVLVLNGISSISFYNYNEISSITSVYSAFALIFCLLEILNSMIVIIPPTWIFAIQTKESPIFFQSVTHVLPCVIDTLSLIFRLIVWSKFSYINPIFTVKHLLNIFLFFEYFPIYLKYKSNFSFDKFIPLINKKYH